MLEIAVADLAKFRRHWVGDSPVGQVLATVDVAVVVRIETGVPRRRGDEVLVGIVEVREEEDRLFGRSVFQRMPGQVDDMRRGDAVAIAMAVHVVGAGVFGASVPILANRFGLDPAMVSTPAVTAIADLAGATLFVLVVLVLVS